MNESSGVAIPLNSPSLAYSWSGEITSHLLCFENEPAVCAVCKKQMQTGASSTFCETAERANSSVSISAKLEKICSGWGILSRIIYIHRLRVFPKINDFLIFFSSEVPLTWVSNIICFNAWRKHFSLFTFHEQTPFGPHEEELPLT